MKLRGLVLSLVVLFLAACTLPVTSTGPVVSSTVDTVNEPVDEESSATQEAPAMATEEGATMSLVGDWDGQISIMGTQLGFVVHFSRESGELTATLDIPQQGARGYAGTRHFV